MFSRRVSLGLAILLVMLCTRSLLAHPMGNFSVNHYSRIEVQSDRIRVQYVIDLAEIPTYQELQQGGITATPGDAAVTRFVAGRGAEFGRGLLLTVEGKLLPLRLRSSDVIFPPGAGGLPTMKMGFVYEAAYPVGMEQADAKLHSADAKLHYTDTNYAGHTGWKEIVVQGRGDSLKKSSVASADRSGALTNYPTDLLNSPPQDLEASFEVALPLQVVAAAAAPTHPVLPKESVPQPLHASARSAGSLTVHPKLPVASAQAVEPAAAVAAPQQLQGNQQKTPRSRFTELITEQRLSPWFLFTAALIAMGLGALHALEPGHGKTIVAAYLVGSRGTARHAMLLGLIVTASHTVGVFALGAITLYASRYIVPEQLYPWLGVLSGITIAGLGLYMLMRRLTGAATDHSHGADGLQGHWPFAKRPFEPEAEAGQQGLQAAVTKPVGLAQLLTLGITGGIIPCPAALIVLLSAFALHRIALGFFLIVAFSVGLAAVLIGFGMAMVYARRFMTHLQVDGPLTKRWLPVASSAFITILGMAIAFQALVATHLSLFALGREKLGTVLFVSGLGLVLGMRHSTDADHVVAISTIVSKQRSIRNAAVIGSVWGLGHTITIFIVGSLIILFGVEIPPRVGLSMEFCVAIMLILLGVLNLTGVMQKITARYTPAGLFKEAATKNESARAGARRGRLFEGRIGRVGLYQCVRPLVIGLVHGLAGSAAVALLVLTTIHNPVWATIYLLIFGGGTMVGMMCMTATIAVPLTYAGDRFGNLGRYFGVASGMVSLCFGCFLVYQLGFLGGLFTSHPQWTPR